MSDGYYPPNWADRPRVEPWNKNMTAESLAERDKDDLISIIGLLNAQMTTAKQDSLDTSNLNIWHRHQLVEALGEAGRAYRRLLDARRRGRKSVRLSELFDRPAPSVQDGER